MVVAGQLGIYGELILIDLKKDKYNIILELMHEYQCINDIIIKTGFTKGSLQYMIQNLLTGRYIKARGNVVRGTAVYYIRTVDSLTHSQLDKIRNVREKKSNPQEKFEIPKGGRIIKFRDDGELQKKVIETQRLRDSERKTGKVAIGSSFDVI